MKEKKPLLYTKMELKELLKNNVLLISFKLQTKETLRIKCSLMEHFFPKQDSGKFLIEQQNNNKSHDILGVWDVENSAWRSFHVDQKIINVEIIEEKEI